MHKLLVLYVCVALLAGCSSAPYKAHTDTSASVSGVRIDLSDEHKVRQILNQQYDDWRNVKHRMGGMSRKGIDCSGLVYQTYRTKLGVELPRSTENQSKIGLAVKQEQLRAGDLVFFKTGVFTRHVGMYIDEGKFLHVSSSNGVMVSNLEDSYWRSAYWKARRVQ
jgi:cell wall-associated NlpC family hydrolase